MIEKKLVKVAYEGAPNQCTTAIKSGPCPYECLPGSDRCPRHAAGFQAANEKAKLRNYNLTKWQSRINKFADNEQVKSLREEIGILRIMLEETMQRCADADDLFLYSNRITDLVMKIEKIVKSCHSLEFATGNLLDKGAILHISSVIVSIISNYVDDPKVIDQVGSEIVTMIEGVTNGQKEVDSRSD